jgi:hypothetical protein
MVWGSVPHARPDYGDFIVKCYDGLAKVRTKVTPFAANAEGVLRGQVPAWYEGETITLARAIETAGGIGAGPHVGGMRYNSGTHATYLDGKQRWVNCFHWWGVGADPSCTVATWHQYDIQENVSNYWVMVSHGGVDEPSYDADYDMYEGGQSWSDVPSDQNFYSTTFQDQMNLCYGNGSYVRKLIRPDAWSASQRYLCFSSYLNTDGIAGLVGFYVAIFDNNEATPENASSKWTYTLSSMSSTENSYKVVRPSYRQYQANETDQPWFCGYNGATGNWGTGRWTGGGANLTPIHEYTTPTALGQLANCIHYSRIRDKDLFIFRKYKEGVGPEATRSADYWVYTGDEWLQLSALGYSDDQPSCISMDTDGVIYWGRARHVRRYTSPGWEVEGEGSFLSGETAVSLPEGAPASDPEDPENNVEDPEYEVVAASQYEAHTFQILPASGCLHVKGFWGDSDLATLPIEHTDWAAWKLADTDNSRGGQARAADVLFCWSVSTDGSVWVPHLQAHYPYQAGSDTTTRRIVGREYCSHDTTEWAPEGQYGDPAFYKTKYRSSNFQHDQVDGMQAFKPWEDRFGGTYPLGDPLTITYDKFICEQHNRDFDPVVKCCGCGSGTVAR